MSWTVVFRETALRNLARIRREDKDLFTRTRQAVASLAGARPEVTHGSRSWMMGCMPTRRSP